MLPDIDSYGLKKRFDFLCDSIRESEPESVLDFGCGAGTYVTAPLAEEFPHIRFVGVDADAESIYYAQQQYLMENLRFASVGSEEALATYDMVIASEVIEHVDEPVAFLKMLVDRLNPDGRLLLTLPNGYGPFEIASFGESVLHLTGILPLLSRIRRLGSKKVPHVGQAYDTLAVSPHINFFSWRGIQQLFGGAGLSVLQFQPRTFLCGFGADQILRNSSVLRWNAQVSDSLPAWCASGWMFFLKPDKPGFGATPQRGIYAGLRTWLNRKRVGL